MELVNAWIGRKYEMEIFGEPSWRKLVEAIAHKAGGCHKRQALKLADDHPVFNGVPFQIEDRAPVVFSLIQFKLQSEVHGN